jgi:hypothetical protein
MRSMVGPPLAFVQSRPALKLSRAGTFYAGRERSTTLLRWTGFFAHTGHAARFHNSI